MYHLNSVPGLKPVALSSPQHWGWYLRAEVKKAADGQAREAVSFPLTPEPVLARGWGQFSSPGASLQRGCVCLRADEGSLGKPHPGSSVPTPEWLRTAESCTSVCTHAPPRADMSVHGGVLGMGHSQPSSGPCCCSTVCKTEDRTEPREKPAFHIPTRDTPLRSDQVHTPGPFSWPSISSIYFS